MIGKPTKKRKLEVLERDGYVCQLCGCLTLKELRGTHHPLAPEVDHIIPRRLPECTNDLSNLRCACHSCNQLHDVHVRGGKASGALGFLKLLHSKKDIDGKSIHAKKLGHVTGKKNVESGHWAALKTPEHQKKASIAGIHSRWHVARGVVNPNCELCSCE